MAVLDGVEFQKELGDAGSIKIDVTPELKVVAEVAVKKEIDLLAIIKELAEKSATPIDDKVIEFLEKIIKK